MTKSSDQSKFTSSKEAWRQQNLEYHRAYNKQYRIDNAVRLAAYGKAYRALYRYCKPQPKQSITLKPFNYHGTT